MVRAVVHLLLALVVLAVCLVGGCMLRFRQGLDNPIMIRLKSPRMPGAEILLCERGFQDRDMAIFAKMPSKDGPTYIAERGHLNADSLVVGWSNDGQVAVFMFSHVEYDFSSGQPKTREDALAGAYDFSTGKALLEEEAQWENILEQDPGRREAGGGMARVLTASGSKTLGDIHKRNEAAVKALVVRHGGLDGNRLTSDRLRAAARKVWFWQCPQDKESRWRTLRNVDMMPMDVLEAPPDTAGHSQ
jgi:hypothetical protein